MFGFRYIKAQPTEYVIQFKSGLPVREGAGLSAFYFAPNTTLVVVPTASVNEPFIFEEVTADYQHVTVQGQITYRIAEPKRTASMLNFALDAKGGYASEDPLKLDQRLIDQVQVAMRAELQAVPMKTALNAGDTLVHRIRDLLLQAPTLDGARASRCCRFRSSPSSRSRKRPRRWRPRRARRCCAAPTKRSIPGATPRSSRSVRSRRTSSRPRSRSRTRSARSRRRRWKPTVRCASAAARSSRRR